MNRLVIYILSPTCHRSHICPLRLFLYLCSVLLLSDTKARLLNLTPYQSKMLQAKRRKIEEHGIFSELEDTVSSGIEDNINEPVPSKESEVYLPKTLSVDEAIVLENSFRYAGGDTATNSVDPVKNPEIQKWRNYKVV